MRSILPKTTRFASIHYSAALLSVFSGLLFGFSWPGLGQFWFLAAVALLPLFWLHQWRLAGFLTNTAFNWFIVFAFFLWNSSALYFLFNIEESVGIKLLTFLTPVVINMVWMTVVMVGFSRLTQKTGKVLGYSFFVCAWLSIEYVQHHWTLAFPWLSLGNLMAPHPQLIQWYSITGVAGGALLILLANFGLFEMISGGRSTRWKWGVLTGLLGLPFLWSALVVSADKTNSAPVARFTIIQPGLENENEKFIPELALENLENSLQLVHWDSAVGTIVLPETFVFEPGKISGPPQNLQFSGLWFHDLSRSQVVAKMRALIDDGEIDGVIAGVYMSRFYRDLSSAPPIAHPIHDIGAGLVHYNSALLMDSSAAELRHKTMLVVGVEQVPFAESLPLLNDLAIDLGGVVGSLGRSEKPQACGLAGTSVGVQICYDSAFGWLSNDLVSDGAQVLVVLTNDSWWGNTPGHQQLLSFAQLRAIETGRSVVRCANNGISAFISPRGEIINSLNWDQKGAITSDVAQHDHITFYTRWGDYVYGLAAICLPLILLTALWWQRKPTKVHR